jgi:hypothetical protein
MTAYTNHGKTSSAKRNSGRKTNWVKGIIVQWRGLCLKIIELLQQRWWQNSIFILKTLFSQNRSDRSFTNPTSTVQLQLLNLWLPKTMLKGKNDGMMIIKPGCLMTGNM